jgi:hypothetical protein
MRCSTMELVQGRPLTDLLTAPMVWPSIVCFSWRSRWPMRSARRTRVESHRDLAGQRS